LTAAAIVGTNATLASLLSVSTITAAAGNITALSAANIVLGTNITVGSMMSASSANIASNLQANSILVTNLSVGAGLTMTLGAPVLGRSYASSGGSTNTLAMQLPTGPVVMLNVTSAGAYFALPAPVYGLACDVVNVGSVTGNLVPSAGAGSSNSIDLTTVRSLGKSASTDSGLQLICDGTNWWRRNK